MRRRMYFVFLVLVALMLGMLIFMVDSSPGWDDTGVSAAMVFAASGLMGAIHPARAWVWALAIATAGTYAGALIGRVLTNPDPAR
jgi:peptidoglycan/LPS O-acetylase OafA/YrhL